jgi:hypothetical protein
MMEKSTFEQILLHELEMGHKAPETARNINHLAKRSPTNIQLNISTKILQQRREIRKDVDFPFSIFNLV